MYSSNFVLGCDSTALAFGYRSWIHRDIVSLMSMCAEVGLVLGYSHGFVIGIVSDLHLETYPSLAIYSPEVLFGSYSTLWLQ